MTQPPSTVGSQPPDAITLNTQIGMHLRTFLNIKNMINQDRDFLQATSLTAEPYNFTTDQETLIKSAILELDTALDGIDMTFISRVIGLG